MSSTILTSQSLVTDTDFSLVMLAVGALLHTQSTNALAAIQQSPEWKQPTPEQQAFILRLQTMVDLSVNLQQRSQQIHDKAQFTIKGV